MLNTSIRLHLYCTHLICVDTCIRLGPKVTYCAANDMEYLYMWVGTCGCGHVHAFCVSACPSVRLLVWCEHMRVHTYLMHGMVIFMCYCVVCLSIHVCVCVCM